LRVVDEQLQLEIAAWNATCRRRIFIVMSTRPHQLVTAEQFYRLPHDGERQELLRGTVVSEPSPNRTHGRTVARLAALIEPFVRARRLGVVYAADTGFVLARNPDTVRGPDVAFVSEARERRAGAKQPYFPGAPDLAIEVVSPSDRTKEILGKVSDYLSAGSRMVWVVDPASEAVQVFRSPFQPRRLASEDLIEGEDVLPGFSIAVAQIFS
jgi:Uma2 family endonuclease